MQLMTTLFSFRGRIGRRPYWLTTLALFSLIIVFAVASSTFVAFVGLESIMANKGYTARQLEQLNVSTTLFMLLINIPTTAIAVKRLNDIGWPTWLGYATGIWTALIIFAEYFGFVQFDKYTTATSLVVSVNVAVFLFLVVIGCIRSADETGHGIGDELASR